ncbi:retrovirus-related pol polyprotein from transposon TNT 1-94 [Tanacetum coccineum]
MKLVGTLVIPTNKSETLGKLQPNADIGIFIGYAPTKKAFRIYNQRTRRVNETIHVDFDELTAMASEHSSSGPALHEMTPATISSRLVPKTSFLQTTISPEVIALIPEVVAPEPTASTGSPSSTTVDQDAPSPKNDSEVSSSSDVIHTVVHTATPNSEHVNLDEIGGILKNKARLVAAVIPSRRGTAHEYDRRTNDVKTSFLNDILLKKLCQQPDGLQISQSPRGIFLNQSKYALESLKKYGMESSDPVDTPMVEKSKLDEDTQGKAVDPTHYRGMIGTLMYLTASRPDLTFVDSSIALTAYADADHAGCQDTRRSTSGCMQLLGDRLMRSQLTDYGLGFNKIPMYCDNKSAIALCCNNVQHSRSKHIDIRFHFIKEQVENGVVELYFVNTEYQLADIFTKALCRERIEFLINKLGMRSFTPETLKQLADEAEE